MTERAPFSRDEPVSLSHDAFGHRDYTETLVSIINDDSPPPTIGVFGPWGVGKSTIIGGIQDHLAGGETAFVYFDAWRYEGDSLRRQFLLDAAHQLDNDKRLKSSYSPDEELRELHVDTHDVAESLGFSKARLCRAALIGLGFAVLIALLLISGLVGSVLQGNFGQTVLASLAAFTLGTFATLISQTVVVNANTTTIQALRDPDRFATKFADLLRALRPRRLVIAIDNLDRCSPESAIEMLSTIKTYLEPAVAGETRPSSSAIETVDKQVVFVVSVDDKALRRHLVAKETERSRDEDALAIRRYVDEYLAKFFSARLPIRAILPDDMRGYIAEHLKPLIKARVPDKDQARELVNLVAAGLRRNPRRVKQFNNDLESRLRLLEERERGEEDQPPGINPPVSGEVRMVAKLALIESEWPEAFERLERHPPLLAKWEELIETEDEVDWLDDDDLSQPADERARGRQARRDFATFLGQARTIQTDHLRAMLSLKQAPGEVGLPGFTEFRAAATSGDRAQVGEILSENSDDDRAKLVARLPDVLGDELRAGDFPAARAIVDVAASLEVLRPFEQARRQIINLAASTPSLRRELALLNPAAVLASADLASAANRRYLFEPFVARMVNEEIDDERRRTAAEALAPFSGELSEPQRAQIYTALDEGGLRNRFPVYRAFAEAAPDLIPPSAAEAALHQVEETAEGVDGEGEASLSAHTDALAVATLGLPGTSDADLQQRAVQHVLTTVRAFASKAELAAELEGATKLLAGLESVAVETWNQLAQELLSNWGAYLPEAHRSLFAFIGEFLPRAASDVQQQVPVDLLDRLFEDPDHALIVIGELDPLPPALRPATLDRLVAHGSDPTHWEAGVEALTRLGGEETPVRIAAVFEQLIAGGNFDVAWQLVQTEDGALRPQLPQLADRAAPHLQARVISGEPLPAELFETLADAMSAGEIAVMGNVIAARLRDGGENATQLLNELRERPKSRLRDFVVDHALDLLVGLDAFNPEVAPLLGAVCANVPRLNSQRQAQLAEKLAAWFQAHPGQLALLSEATLEIEGLAAEPAKTLVDGLLDTERATEDPAIRRQLLNAAFHLKGKPRSKALAVVRKRMGELEAGGEIDKEIAAEFAPQLTGK
ncbi:MAG: P-loop NTPase fold protein [Solirubrobacterales bacterium]